MLLTTGGRLAFSRRGLCARFGHTARPVSRVRPATWGVCETGVTVHRWLGHAWPSPQHSAFQVNAGSVE